MGRQKTQVVGYDYRVGMHLVLCHGPVDALQEIRVGDRNLWGNSDRLPRVSGFGLGRLKIDRYDLFGGYQREGGIKGEFDVLSGAKTQGRNDYLQSVLGKDIPAFRGVLSFICRKAILAVNNPYLKPWAFRVRRFLAGWNTELWFPEVAIVSRRDPGQEGQSIVGMNPAHILVQCLTDPDWGMGYPLTSIGDRLYSAAAELRSAGVGLNLLWTRQQPIESFIALVLDHIGGILYTDAETGQFQLALIQDEATSSTTQRRLGPDEIVEVLRFERALRAELPNEITVVYTDWETGSERTVTAENLAAIAVQGGVINQRRDYPGVIDPTLAARLAMRDLKALGTPLARMTLKLTPTALGFNSTSLPKPGDRLRLHWPRLQIEEMIIRVLGIETGTLTEPELIIEAVEDVFSLDSAVVADEPGRWQLPPTTPQPPTLALAFEVPYWELARRLSRADLAVVEDTDTWVAVLTANAAPAQLNWELRTGSKADALQEQGAGDYAPLLTLTQALPQTEATQASIPFTPAAHVERLKIGDYAYLVDNRNQLKEAVEILAIDTVANTVSVARGVLDTTPQLHAAGTRLIGVGDWAVQDSTDRAPTETVFAQAVPKTASARGNPYPVNNSYPMTLTGRQGRPYPPGLVRINGKADPEFVAGAVTVTWAHRHRKQQTATLVRQDAASIGPEPGTTYSVRVTDKTNAPVITLNNLEVTTATVDAATLLALGIKGDTLTVEIETVREGLTSFQAQRRTIQRAGYGLRYGQSYGGQ